MWIDRTQEEIVEAKRRRFRGDLSVGLISWLLATLLMAGLRGKGHAYPGIVQDEMEFYSRLPSSALVSLLVIGLSLIIYRRSPTHPTFICTACDQIREGKGPNACSCGGEFKPADQLRWVDEDPR